VGIFSVQEELIVDKAGRSQAPEEAAISSELLSEFSSAPVEDIPAAVREQPEPLRYVWWKQRVWRWGIAGVGAMVLVWSRASESPGLGFNVNSPAAEPEPAEAAIASPTAEAVQDAQDALLGHFPYREAPESELVPVTDDGSIRLRQPAADKFLEMMAAAKAEGVELVPLSGFRSVEEQEGVFFEIKAERGQQATKRAEVSAPPGYSEHHTGYAIDLGDRYYPDADLKTSFENTAAFKWLQTNAGYYSFELSFPTGNDQGVSYEPWHWRFVGDRDSLETFYQVRGSNQPASRPNTDSSSASERSSDAPSEESTDQ
jgi:zinc D-Ala-D-Ala carboxypeptidase